MDAKRAGVDSTLEKDAFLFYFLKQLFMNVFDLPLPDIFFACFNRFRPNWVSFEIKIKKKFFVR